MTKAWPEVSLGQLLEKASVFTDGDWVESKDQDPEGSVRLIQLADIGDGSFVDKSARFLTRQKAEELKCTFLRAGDILVARMPDPLGRACIFPGSKQECVTVVDVCVIRPPSDEVDTAWLVSAINAPQFRRQIEQFASGTTRSRISRSNLAKLRLQLPPLDEQRRIAAILDKADEVRAKRKAALETLETLSQAIFIEMFGDPVTNPMGWQRLPLKSILTGIESGSSPICLDRPAEPGEWGVLKLGAITRCTYDDSQSKALPPEVEPEVQHEIAVGDLLFSRKNTRDHVGATALVGDTQGKLLMSDLIFRLKMRPDAEVTSSYLQQLLIFPTKRKEIQRLAGGSAGSMPNISKAKLSASLIELPPLRLQEEFERRVFSIGSIRDDLNSGLRESGQIFSALQQKAFQGAL